MGANVFFAVGVSMLHIIRATDFDSSLGMVQRGKREVPTNAKNQSLFPHTSTPNHSSTAVSLLQVISAI